jgi:hypothetical protein
VPKERQTESDHETRSPLVERISTPTCDDSLYPRRMRCWAWVALIALGCGSSAQSSDGSAGAAATSGGSPSGGSSGAAGGSSSTASAGSAGSVALLGPNATTSQISTALAAAWCRKEFSCCASDIAADFAAWPSVPASVADCTSLAAWRAAFDVHAIVEEVPLGNVQFHPELADACVAAMDAVSCAGWPGISGIGALSPYAPCQGLAQGMIADGGACTGEFDCVSGECSIGSCVPLASLGASCEGSCKAGLRCIGTPFTCQPKVEAGGACQGDSDCISAQCDTGVCASACTVR